MILPHSESFLQSKIMDIRQALFFNDSRSVLKFPVSIINVLHTDEVGQIWFIVNRPAQHLNEFEKEFRARLNFYKKGKNYFLHIKGKACIVSDPEEINNVHGLEEDIKILSSSTMALIRMKIEKIYYYPAKKQAPEVEPVIPKLTVHSLAVVKRLQYIIKDIIPVFQSH